MSGAAEDVAIGVVSSGQPGDAESSRLTRNRSHRLETVDPALFQALGRAGETAVDAYVRQLTQQVAYGVGAELSSTAQSVARALISGHWPSDNEWRVLRADYMSAHLMAGSQRPGIEGIEYAPQLATYQQEFIHCRRLETLLCWDSGDHADIVYAARAAGVTAPLIA